VPRRALPMASVCCPSTTLFRSHAQAAVEVQSLVRIACTGDAAGQGAAELRPAQGAGELSDIECVERQAEAHPQACARLRRGQAEDRKSTRLNSSHVTSSSAVFR